MLETFAGIIFARISDRLPYFVNAPVESHTPLCTIAQYV